MIFGKHTGILGSIMMVADCGRPPSIGSTSEPRLGGVLFLSGTVHGRLVRNRTALAQGIDVRGDGGYIVAPPSVHPSGRRHAWVPGRSPAEMMPAALPRWVFVGSGGPRLGRSRDEWRRLVREGCRKASAIQPLHRPIRG